MKCPKCGYNSFEIHDTCKKCANDLIGYKNTHGLRSVVLPLEARSDMAEKLMAQSSQDAHAMAADIPADMFSFDIPESDPVAIGNSFPVDDPFNFDEQPASPSPGSEDFSFNEDPKSAQARAEEEAFADLLETSSKVPQAAEVPVTDTQDTGEDLSNFSWDDTPDEPSGGETKSADDFNNLFGETDEAAKK
jgi:hypothetical protein